MSTIQITKSPDDLFGGKPIGQMNLKELERALDKQRNNSIWYRPSNGKFYEADDPHANRPSYDKEVADSSLIFAGRNTVRGMAARGYYLSSTEIDKTKMQPFTNEFSDKALRFFSAMDKVKKGELSMYALITTADYAPIFNTQIAASAIDLTNRDFVLDQVATVQRTDFIQTFYPTITPFRNKYPVGENAVTDPMSVDYALVPIFLQKGQGHVQWSRWATMTPRYFDPVADSRALIDADFPRLINTDLAQTLTLLTDNAAAGSWKTIGGSAFYHTFHPTADIFDTAKAVRGAGGRASLLVMNSYTFYIMLENAWMRQGGLLTGSPAFGGNNPRIVTHPLLPGYVIAIEELVADGDVFELDPRTFLRIIGPARSATYDKTPEYVAGQIVDNWFASALRITTWGEQITGTTA